MRPREIFPALFCVLIGAIPALAQTPSETLYAPRTDWSVSAGALNLSSYVYIDDNRNGSYDLGERPMAAVYVALAYDGEGVAISRSNLNGFANFESSLTKEGAPISQPGRYTFQVIVPPNWQVTSGNDTQFGDVVLVEGANAGLGLVDMVKPVGLAQDLAIRGVYAAADPGHIRLMKNGSEITGGAISPGDSFLFKTEAGDYTLSDGTSSWQVSLQEVPVDIGHLSGRMQASGAPDLITFEDFGVTMLTKVPNGYHDLNWFNLNAMSREMVNGSEGYNNGATSGSIIAYTSSGHPAEISSEQPFNFHSVDLTGAWANAEGEIVSIEMWRGDEKFVDDRIAVSALGPVRYSPDAAGVTRIRITSQHYWQLVLDDIVVSR